AAGRQQHDATWPRASGGFIPCPAFQTTPPTFHGALEPRPMPASSLPYPQADRQLRILVVTSQFPIAGEPNRGRPLLLTIRALSTMASVRVVSPVAVYPSWARPRSYLF